MMGALLIAAIIVMGALTAFLFFMLRRLVLAINTRIRQDFILQLDEYDDMVAGRFERYETLQRNIEEAEKSLSMNTAPIAKKTTSKTFVTLTPSNQLLPGDFGADYEIVRTAFSFDREKTVGPVLRDIRQSDHFSATARLESMRTIREALEFSTLYELVTLSPEDQLSVLCDSFTPNELELLDEHIDINGWESSLEFVEWIKTISFLEEPTMTVKLSPFERTDWISGLDEPAPTTGGREMSIEKSADLCEGLQIISQGKLYDFGLSTKELA